MIQAMRMSPKTTPCPADAATMAAGIRKTTSARTADTPSPTSAATHTRASNPTSVTKRDTTGSADSAVESSQLPRGS